MKRSTIVGALLVSTSAGCSVLAGLSGDYTLLPQSEAGTSADGSLPGDETVTPIPDASTEIPDVPVPPVSGNGRVLYAYNSTYYLIEAVAGASPAPIAPSLNAISPGTDSRVNMGADGSIVVETTRFGCSNPCLAIFAPDLKTGAKVTAGGKDVTDMRDIVPAVAGNGNLVVFGGRGVHQRDLFVSVKTSGGWSAAKSITDSSTQSNNFKPFIAPDASKVVFDCGDDPFGASNTSVCEVGIDGTGFRKVIGPEGGPGGGKNTHSPAYNRDGTIVFEGEWGSEQIWRIPPGGGAPALINGTFSNDNTPCVLPNGKIVSLWLQRSGNPQGFHELKLMNADGSGMVMLQQGFDIEDIGLGCGN